MAKNAGSSGTMQVVNALVKADKNFELFIMPGQGHGVLSTEYGKRRLEDFFERTLGGGEINVIAKMRGQVQNLQTQIDAINETLNELEP